MASSPFGGIVSFANLPTLDPTRASVVRISDDRVVAMAHTGAPYPFDHYGLSQAPYDHPTAEFEYLLVAAYGQTASASYADVEAQFNAIRTALRGTYTMGTTTGVSGEVGYLTVQTASGAGTAKAFARCISAPQALKSGINTYAYLFPFKFILLSDWQ